MILDTQFWDRWEADFQKRDPIDVEKNFRLMDAMYQESRQLGLSTHSDPLEGLEPVLLYAKAINVPTTPRQAV